MCSLCRPRSLQAAEDSIAAGDAEIARLEAQLKLLEEETTPQGWLSDGGLKFHVHIRGWAFATIFF